MVEYRPGEPPTLLRPKRSLSQHNITNHGSTVISNSVWHALQQVRCLYWRCCRYHSLHRSYTFHHNMICCTCQLMPRKVGSINQFSLSDKATACCVIPGFYRHPFSTEFTKKMPSFLPFFKRSQVQYALVKFERSMTS